MKFAILAGLLAGLCSNLSAATVTVSDVPSLTAAINGGAAGDTVLINAGTYTFNGSNTIGGNPAVAIHLPRAITLKAVSGPGTVIINCSTGHFIGISIEASNTVIDGLTINNSQFGVQAQNNSSLTITGIILRNLNISTTNATSNGGHAISFSLVTNSIIELSTVTYSYNHGISIGNSTSNLIINNNIITTQTQDGIAMVDSDRNTITGNSIGIGGSIGFDGVAVQGSQYNYIGYNNIANVHNGVTLTLDPGNNRPAIRNWVGNNHIVLHNVGGSDPLWFNNTSDYSMAFANDGTGAAENGMALYTSRGDYVVANVFFNNPQGGIFINGTSGGPTADRNVLQQNYLYNHQSNGGVITQGSTNDDVSFNFIAGNPANISQFIAGYLLQNSSGGKFYSNTIKDLKQGENITNTVTTTTLYTNRHFNTPIHTSTPPNTSQWDSGNNVLGGSFYSDFAPGGNPSSGSTPYTNIINGGGQGGVYKDNYPYQSENLGKAYGMIVQNPAAGSFLAATPANSTNFKTISWIDQGCVFVDLNLVSATNVSTTIVSNYPDFGFYRWAVPAVAPGSYTVQVNCKDSNTNPTGTSASSSAFNITTSDLVLLSPQRNLMVDSGTAVQFSWKKSSNVTAVDVYIRYSDAAAYTLLQAGVTNDFVTITLPSPPASNRASVKIISGSFADSTDGWFTTRANSTGQFTSPAAAGGALFVGTPYLLEWISPSGTDYIDIDLVGGASTQNLVTKLGDFGRYLALIPNNQGSSTFKLTFHNYAGTILSTATSPGSSVVAGGGFSFGGGTCTVTVSPLNTTVPGGAGTLNLNINGGACGWSASSTTPWLTPNASSGTGGTLGVTVALNGTAAQRTGTLTVAGQTVTVTQAINNPIIIPSIGSLTPFQGTGLTANLSIVYVDTDGWSAIKTAEFIVNPRWEPNQRGGGCYVSYSNATGLLTLTADDGVSIVGTTAPGSAVNLSNSACTLNAASTTVSGSGNNLTLNASLTFSPAFTGQKHIWVQATDYNNLTTNWLVYGVWFPTQTALASTPWYRIYDPNSKSYLYSADQNEYNYLGTQGFLLQGISGLTLTGVGSVATIPDIAWYRVFVSATNSHFWTSDRNEFVSLVTNQTAYVGEGVATFVMPYINALGQVSPQVSNSIPFWRAAYQGANLHFWTADPNEYNGTGGKSLPTGYIGEGIACYIFPASGAVLSSQPPPPETLVQSAVVAPGQALTVYGRNLRGTVLIDGVPAQVIDRQSDRIQVLIPHNLSSASEVNLEVEHQGRRTAPIRLTVVPSNPAIIGTNVWGKGNAQARNEDGAVNTPDQAAARGSLVTLFTTGYAGALHQPIEVHIGGRPAEVLSTSISGTRAGVIELQVRVPDSLEPAAFQPVVLHIGRQFSQPGVGLAVK